MQSEWDTQELRNYLAVRELYKMRKKIPKPKHFIQIKVHLRPFISIFIRYLLHIPHFLFHLKQKHFKSFCSFIKGNPYNLGKCCALCHLPVLLSFPPLPHFLSLLTSPWIRQKVISELHWVAILCSFSLQPVLIALSWNKKIFVPHVAQVWWDS